MVSVSAIENRTDSAGNSFRVARLATCPQCGSDDVSELMAAEDFEGKSGAYAVWTCGSCHALFCNPQVLAEDIPKLYEARDTQDFNPTVDPKSAIFRLRSLHARRQIKGILRRIGRPAQFRAMDFGCGDGMFSLALANTPGCSGVSAVDFHSDPPPTLAAGQVEYHSVSDLASGAHDGRYELTICRHIVEHVAHPIEFVRQMAGYLKPGGYLFVEVPNYRSAWRRLFGKHWSILYVPRHLYWFTMQNVRSVFAGFDIIDIYGSETPTIGGSLRLRFGLPINNTDVVGVGLYPIQAAIEKLTGESSTLIVLARKPTETE